MNDSTFKSVTSGAYRCPVGQASADGVAEAEACEVVAVGLQEGYFPASNTGVKYPGLIDTLSGFTVEGPFLGVESPLQLYHAGVDWGTFSATTAAAYECLEMVWCDRVWVERQHGYSPKPAKWMQYRGHSIGSLFFGSSIDGWVLRASSRVAGDIIDTLRVLGGWEVVRCTRLDLQITLLYPPAVVNPEFPAYSLFRQIADASYVAAHAPGRGRGRPWHTDLKDSYGRGDTAYIGDRSSESFLRSYNKHFESRNNPEVGQYPPGAVRFESEQKGSQAVKQFQALMGMQGHVIPGYAAGYVAGAFADRGIHVPVDVSRPPLIKTVPEASDTEKTKKWYQTAVAPSVARLLALDVPRAELLELLGLGEVSDAQA